MEFVFDINVLIPQTITRIVGGRLPHSRKHKDYEEMLATVVNEMGVSSARAQGLRTPITTFQKLQSSNQILYVLKDSNCHNGKGAIVGILKVGYKRLFLSDSRGVQHEVEPLCVLDFYVHESRQRSGCGRKLFEAMMQAEDIKPFELAIDRPSPKFVAFLKRHYKLQSHVKQANNFVVFDQFFSTCVDVGPSTRRLSIQRQVLSPSGGRSPWRRSSAHFGEPHIHTLGSPAKGYNVAPVERPSPLTHQSTSDPEARNSKHLVTAQRNSNFNNSMMSPHAGSPAALRENDRKDQESNGREESDANVNWSPDNVTKHHSPNATGSARQGYSIITGLPVTQSKRQPVFGQEVTDPGKGSSHVVKQTVHTTWPSSTASVSKAPFLTMRQQQNRDRTTVNSYGLLHAPSSGFYSTTVGERAGLCRYSRHPSSGAVHIGHGSGGSTGGGEVQRHLQRQRHNAVESLMPGIMGTSIESQPTSSSLPKSKSRGNWKTYIT